MKELIYIEEFYFIKIFFLHCLLLIFKKLIIIQSEKFLKNPIRKIKQESLIFIRRHYCILIFIISQLKNNDLVDYYFIIIIKFNKYLLY